MSCNKHDQTRDAGYVRDAKNFANTFKLDTSVINLNCVYCCAEWLVSTRNYQRADGENDIVVFRDDGIIPSVSAIVREPKSFNGVYGQIATENDLNIGKPKEQTVIKSRKYQLYSIGQKSKLGLGVMYHARIESIRIDDLERGELEEVYLNLSNAVLLELYRKKVSAPSLKGKCYLKRSNREKPSKDKETGLEQDLKKMNLKEEKDDSVKKQNDM